MALPPVEQWHERATVYGSFFQLSLSAEALPYVVDLNYFPNAFLKSAECVPFPGRLIKREHTYLQRVVPKPLPDTGGVKNSWDLPFSYAKQYPDLGYPVFGDGYYTIYVEDFGDEDEFIDLFRVLEDLSGLQRTFDEWKRQKIDALQRL
jgi:hypothetical protein